MVLHVLYYKRFCNAPLKSVLTITLKHQENPMVYLKQNLFLARNLFYLSVLGKMSGKDTALASTGFYLNLFKMFKITVHIGYTKYRTNEYKYIGIKYTVVQKYQIYSTVRYQDQ